MNTSSFTSQYNHQVGAALITSLIFLTVLTILGMSTMGTSLLESRMAGNTRDRNLAFQSAEVGLRDAENYIRSSGRIVGLTEEGYDNTAGCSGLAGDECDAQTCKYGLCYNGGTMNANSTTWYDDAVWNVEALWGNAIQYALPGVSVAGPSNTARKVIGYAKQDIMELNAATGNCEQIIVNCLVSPYAQPVPLPLVRRQPEYLIEAFQKNVGGSRYYYRITVRGYGIRSGTRVMLQEVYTP